MGIWKNAAIFSHSNSDVFHANYRLAVTNEFRPLSLREAPQSEQLETQGIGSIVRSFP
jgi:hypothetical protein